MKMGFPKRYLYIAISAFLVIAASILFYTAISNPDSVASAIKKGFSILQPIIIGCVIAYVLSPLINIFERLYSFVDKKSPKPKLKRGLALFTTYIIVVAFIVLLFIVIVPNLFKSLTSLINNIPDYINTLKMWFEKLLTTFGMTKINATTQVNNIINPINEFFNISTELIKKISPYIYVYTVSLTSSLMNTIIGIILSIYLLASKEKFIFQTKKILFAFTSDKFAKKSILLTRTTHRIVGRFISGKILDAIVIGFLCYILMLIFGFKYAILISVIIGITKIVPFFGPILGSIPSIIITLTVSPQRAFWFTIFILLLNLLDANFIGPKIYGKSTGISAFWVIFAILIFGGSFGVIGMVIGVPVVAVGFYFLRLIIEDRLAERGLDPTSSVFDLPPQNKEKNYFFSKIIKYKK